MSFLFDNLGILYHFYKYRILKVIYRCILQLIMQQSMYSPTHPTAGQPVGYHGGCPGVCCLFKPLGCGGFLKFCPQARITGFIYIENHSDYSSDC